MNDGVVYALYSYVADEKDELSFECGEELHILRRGDNTEKEWWWAENSQGLNSGYVPRNLLGVGNYVSGMGESFLTSLSTFCFINIRTYRDK